MTKDNFRIVKLVDSSAGEYFRIQYRFVDHEKWKYIRSTERADTFDNGTDTKMGTELYKPLEFATQILAQDHVTAILLEASKAVTEIIAIP